MCDGFHSSETDMVKITIMRLGVHGLVVVFDSLFGQPERDIRRAPKRKIRLSRECIMDNHNRYTDHLNSVRFLQESH